MITRHFHYNNSMIVKVLYKKETHVMVLDEANYPRLTDKIRASFVKLPETLNLTYMDS